MNGSNRYVFDTNVLVNKNMSSRWIVFLAGIFYY